MADHLTEIVNRAKKTGYEKKTDAAVKRKEELVKPGSFEDLFDKLSFKSVSEKLQLHLHNFGLVEPLHRIYFIGSHDLESRQKVIFSFEECVPEIKKKTMDDVSKLTGMLLVERNLFCHVVEGSSDVIDEIIMATDKLVSKGVLIEAKVITTVFEISNRQFENWFSAVLDVARDKKVDFNPYRHAKEGEVHVLARNIRKLKDKDEFSDKMNSLTPWNILPAQNDLSELYEDPFFLTVREHVDRYLSPYTYTLSDEHEWPPIDRTKIFDHLFHAEKTVDEELDKEEKKEKDRFEKDDMKKEQKKAGSSDEDEGE